MKPLYRHPGPAAARITVPEQSEHPSDTDIFRWLSQMQADIAETVGGIMLRAARAAPIGIADGANALVSASPGRLVGWSIRETTGSATAVVRFRNGTDALQPLIGCVDLAAGGTSTQYFGPGVSYTEGLYVETLSGSFEGAVYLGAAD